MAQHDTSADPLARWRRAGDTATPDRIDRRDTLAAARAALAPGLAKSDVETRLGPPQMDHGTAWVYVVGSGAFISWEQDFLVLRFDADGRLDAVEETTSERYARP